MSALHLLETKLTQGVVTAINLFDWLNSTSTTLKVTIVSVGTILIVGMFLVLVFRGGFTIAKVVGAIIVCGLCVWGMITGITWISDIAAATVK